MSIGTILSRATGFVRQWAMAVALGVSITATGAIPIASAFNISNNIPNMIYELVAGLAREGRSVLLVSSYLPELFGMCDRIAVMRRGELAECRPTAAWTEATLMATAIGTAA